MAVRRMITRARHAVTASVVCLGSLLMAAPVRAQSVQAPPASPEPSLRAALTHLADKHGLWGSVGLGRASAGLSCNVCAKDATYAYVLNGQLGIRVAPRLLMGAETFAWLDVLGNGVDRVARGSFLVARAYPAGRSKLFLHGGVGLASYVIDDAELGFRTRSPAFALSTGFDWRLKQMTLTPTLGAVGSIGGDLRSDRTENPIDAHARLLLLRTGVAITWFRSGGIR